MSRFGARVVAQAVGPPPAKVSLPLTRSSVHCASMVKLVSFTTCPFVQRATLILLEKDVSFETEHISLANKPPWFLALSPRGKVPLLLVDGGVALFESQAICE